MFFSFKDFVVFPLYGRPTADAKNAAFGYLATTATLSLVETLEFTHKFSPIISILLY